MPIVAAVSTDDAGNPIRVKLSPVAGFTTKAIADWARIHLVPGCEVRSDGLNCFAGVIDAGCAHTYVVVGTRKPRDLPQFTWVNTVLGNIKTMISGAHKSFKFGKYASQYLGAFCYRFNRRFNLRQIVSDIITHGAMCAPLRERAVRGVGEVHDESGSAKYRGRANAL